MLLSIWAFSVVACSEPGLVVRESERPAAAPSPEAPPEPPGAWHAQPGWPAPLRALHPEGDLNGRVVRVVADPARAAFWVLSYVVMEAGAAPRFALRRYDRAGNVTWSSQESEPWRTRVDAVGAAIGDIAVHPDGAVSVLVLLPVGPYQAMYGAWSRLHFLRFDADGALVRERAFEPPLEAAQPAWCDAPDGRAWVCRLERPDDQPERGVWLGYWRETGMGLPLANRLLADGDGLVLLRADEGYRLHRLDAAYRVIAGTIVLPGSHASRWSAPRVARDAAGRVVVMHVADEVLLKLLAAAGGPRLSLDALTGGDPARGNGVLISYFDGASLERVAAHLIAPPDTMFPSALTADGEEVVAVLNYRPFAQEELSGERQRDVALVRASVAGAAPDYQRIDVAYSDCATDAVAIDGRVWLSGISDAEHGSDVSGLVAGVDREGNVGSLLRLRGPRSVQADAVADGGNGRLLVGGVEDAPDLSECSFRATHCDTRTFVAELPIGDASVRMRADRVPLASTSWRAPSAP